MPTLESLPEGKRYRCGGCGNLTRFTVVRVIEQEEYFHQDLGGAPVQEEVRTLREEVKKVTCRWCNRTDEIEFDDRPDAQESTQDAAPT